MNRLFKHFVIFITICVFTSCKRSFQVSKTDTVNISISDSISADKKIDSFVKPFREHINRIVDSVLCYNPESLTKNDTPLNTALGNWMADSMYERSDPIYFQRTGKHIDFVLLNHGGIRAGLNKGNMTARTAYEIMPFENKVAVVELSAEKMRELLEFLAVTQRAHPISKQLNLKIRKDSVVEQALLHSKPLDSFKTFRVATSDYLANLGDQMDFFSNPVSRTDINYLIRNIFIDTFQAADTLRAFYDDRFTY